MKAFLCLLALTAGLAPVAASKVTPVQKVIELMEGMAQKGKAGKHDEQVTFAAFKQFCDDTTVKKNRAIAEANEMIDMLKADIEKYTADAEQLAKEIVEHEADITAWTGDIKAATKVRKIEKDHYVKTHKDYSESIDALGRAIKVLKAQANDRAQAAEPVAAEPATPASLVQLSALRGLSLIPDDARRAIDAFIAEPDEGLAVTAPEANAYEFQSHGIIEMLEKLLDKFIDERTALEKEEMNAAHAYDMLMQDLKAQIAQAEADVADKSATKAKILEAKAQAEGDLADTTAARDADAKYLADLTATCEQKASDFESRQQLRAEEIEAIEKAIEILSSAAVSGNAEKHLPTLLQSKTASLAQLRADARSPVQQQVAAYLQERSKELNSRVLSALAVRVAGDPFKKVKKMIKDLIVRLMEEANAEAEHKGWCDTELSTNEQTRKEKTAAVETIHAEIDALQASIAKLTEEISELTAAVAALDAAMAKATDIRAAEKAKNTETIADAQDAQTAVAQAVTVLKEFYEKAGEATALVQQKQEPPAIFDSPYKGMQAENGGVVGMLEVIESDFARLESETKAAEAEAQD